METLLNAIPQETLLVIGAYGALGAAYLVVIPLFLYFWMNRRWTVMGKLERLGIYGLVFLFFRTPWQLSRRRSVEHQSDH